MSKDSSSSFSSKFSGLFKKDDKDKDKDKGSGNGNSTKDEKESFFGRLFGDKDKAKDRPRQEEKKRESAMFAMDIDAIKIALHSNDLRFTTPISVSGPPKGVDGTYRWFRSAARGPLTSIAVTLKPEYVPTVEDIGSSVCCQWIPTHGHPSAFAEIGPVQIDPVQLRAAIALLLPGLASITGPSIGASPSLTPLALPRSTSNTPLLTKLLASASCRLLLPVHPSGSSLSQLSGTTAATATGVSRSPTAGDAGDSTEAKGGASLQIPRENLYELGIIDMTITATTTKLTLIRSIRSASAQIKEKAQAMGVAITDTISSGAPVSPTVDSYDKQSGSSAAAAAAAAYAAAAAAAASAKKPGTESPVYDVLEPEALAISVALHAETCPTLVIMNANLAVTASSEQACELKVTDTSTGISEQLLLPSRRLRDFVAILLKWLAETQRALRLKCLSQPTPTDQRQSESRSISNVPTSLPMIQVNSDSSATSQSNEDPAASPTTSQTDASQLAAKLEAAVHREERLLSEIEALRASALERESSRRKLEEEVAKCERELAMFKKLFEDEISQRSAELTRVTERAERAEALLDAAEEKAERLQSELKTAAMTTSDAKAEAEMAKRQIDQLKSQMDALKKAHAEETQKMQRVQDELREKLVTSDSALEALKAANAKLEAEIRELYDSKQSEEHDVNVRLKQAQRRIHELEDEGNQRVANYQEQIKTLSEKLLTAQQEVASFQSKIDELTKACGNAEAQRAECQAELARATSELKTVQSELTAAISNLETNQLQLVQSRKEIDKLTQALHENESHLAELKAHVASGEQALALARKSAEEERKKLKAEHEAELSRRVAEAEAKAMKVADAKSRQKEQQKTKEWEAKERELKDKIYRLEAECKELTGNLERALVRATESEKALAELRSTQIAQSSEEGTTQVKAQDAVHITQQLQSELAEARAALAETKRELAQALDSAESKLKMKSDELTELRNENERLQSEVDERQVERDSLYADLEQVRSECEELSEKLASRDNELKEMHSKLTSQIAEMTSQHEHEMNKLRETFESRIAEHKARIHELERKVDEQKTRISELEQVHLDFESYKVSTATKHQEELDRVRADTKQQILVVEEERTKLVTDLNELKQTLSEHKAEIALLQSKLDDLQRSKEALEKSSGERSVEIVSLRRDLNIARSELARAREELDVAKTQMQTLQQSLLEKNTELDSTQEAFASLEKQFNQYKAEAEANAASSNMELSSLREKNERLTTELNAAEEARQEARKQFNEQSRSQRKEIDKLRSELDAASSKIQALTTQLSGAQEEVEKHVRRSKELDATVSKLEATIANLRTTLDRQTRSVEEAAQKVSDAAAAQARAEQAREEAEARAKAAEESIETEKTKLANDFAEMQQLIKELSTRPTMEDYVQVRSDRNYWMQKSKSLSQAMEQLLRQSNVDVDALHNPHAMSHGANNHYHDHASHEHDSLSALPKVDLSAEVNKLRIECEQARREAEQAHEALMAYKRAFEDQLAKHRADQEALQLYTSASAMSTAQLQREYVDMKRLANSLMEEIQEKEMVLAHMRQCNKILGRRLYELESGQAELGNLAESSMSQ